MEDDEKQRIKVAMIFDIIGKPAEHLVDMLGKLIDEMGNEKGVEVVSKKIKEPVLMKDSKDFYTTFAEVEFNVEEIMYLPLLLFKYMPAHVEVIEPEILALSNNGWNDVLNELARKLHRYDEIARILQAENQDLKKKLEEVTGTKIITPMTLRSELQEAQAEAEKKKKPAKKKSKKVSKKAKK